MVNCEREEFSHQITNWNVDIALTTNVSTYIIMYTTNIMTAVLRKLVKSEAQ